VFQLAHDFDTRQRCRHFAARHTIHHHDHLWAIPLGLLDDDVSRRSHAERHDFECTGRVVNDLEGLCAN
jgi:hypothetical protein